MRFGAPGRLFLCAAQCFAPGAPIPIVYGACFAPVFAILAPRNMGVWVLGILHTGPGQARDLASAVKHISLALRRAACPTLVGGGAPLWGINHGLTADDLPVNPGVY